MVETQNGTASGPVVGFLGLGIMGAAMAHNLLKCGKFAKVIVWNRTLSKVSICEKGHLPFLAHLSLWDLLCLCGTTLQLLLRLTAAAVVSAAAV